MAELPRSDCTAPREAGVPMSALTVAFAAEVDEDHYHADYSPSIGDSGASYPGGFYDQVFEVSGGSASYTVDRIPFDQALIDVGPDAD